MNNIQQKYEQLTAAQKEIFRGYGLRQIKHFVELSLPKIESCLPEHAIVLGLNLNGQVQAVNQLTQQIYLWISDQQWKESQIQSSHIDLKQDFIQIWKTFDLEKQDLIELSHIHRDFLGV
ncbi:hypothetical protein [Acinetobacter sp. ANC 4648]|uniref:hypothetical protein n=1 Tax=Acinetobacter sp. ANC 4648 TaxID=1977875 RepID=UPI000A33A268|nr:hypothetical protein [Acinetobacter sp. ANC 4648]OTG83675.1 hypothetical protein B9T27_03955 [Acinetobacter sp. ANC 4648]